jgi:hypothetical protein
LQLTLGNDQALSFRTTLQAELRYRDVAAGVELADSRVYLADDDTPLSTAHVNPVDVLQAFVTAGLPNVLARGSSLRLKLGRQTMDIGTRRLVARNRYRNTINALTGLHAEWTGPAQSFVRAFVTVPVERRVRSVEDNEGRSDIERWGTTFLGVAVGFRPWLHSIRGEFQVFGLHERDEEDYFSENRILITPGFRLHRAPEIGHLDFELETVIQLGRSRSSDSPTNTTDLSHRAFFFFGSVGFTFGERWRPRLRLEHTYASGDADPSDDENGRFDTLYGARRFDYAPTGIYGPFARSNIKSPGMRFDITPHQDVTAFVGYRTVWLAQARDMWTTTEIQDAEGLSGKTLGHQVEGMIRWRGFWRSSILEGGFAYLRLGRFPKIAPNGSPLLSDPVYLYTQLILQF